MSRAANFSCSAAERRLFWASAGAWRLRRTGPGADSPAALPAGRPAEAVGDQLRALGGAVGALGQQAGAVARFGDPAAQLLDPAGGDAEVAAEPAELLDRADVAVGGEAARCRVPAAARPASATWPGPITACTPGSSAILCLEAVSAARCLASVIGPSSVAATTRKGAS